MGSQLARNFEKGRAQRNLNAHAAAVAAMCIWGERYSKQNGGCMDFWDSLSPSEKSIAAGVAEKVRKARPYTGRV